MSGLNGIIHPRVHGSIQRWFAELPADTLYAIEEAALLIESGGFRLLDELILVTAPEELRIQRVMKRDLVAREQVEARINHQMKESEKRRYCDYIIKNDGEHLLLPQVLSIHQELLAQIL
ncbi:MAG: dephospho-CoA kinase [Saprospiraceae bacterium]|nr:dephospho-CoA kinase [Saprospiraceae bacterium]